MRSFGDGLEGRAQAALVAPAIPDHCGCEDVRYGVADPSCWYGLIGDRVARTAEVTWPEILGDARNDRSRWCDGLEGAPRRWVPMSGSGHGHKVSSKESHADVVERSDSLLCLWPETERLNLVTVVDDELPTDRWRGDEGFGARAGDHTLSVALPRSPHRSGASPWWPQLPRASCSGSSVPLSADGIDRRSKWLAEFWDGCPTAVGSARDVTR